ELGERRERATRPAGAVSERGRVQGSPRGEAPRITRTLPRLRGDRGARASRQVSERAPRASHAPGGSGERARARVGESEGGGLSDNENLAEASRRLRRE